MIKTKKSAIKNAFRLLKYVWEYSKEIFFFKAFIILISVVISVYLNVSLIKIVIDCVATGKSFPYVLNYILIGAVIMFVDILTESIFNQYINPKAKRKIYRGIHTKIFQSIKNVELEKYDDAKFYNDYIWALDRADTELINSFENIMKLFSSILQAIAMIAIICTADFIVLLFIAVPIIINLFVGIYQSNLEYKYERECNPYTRKKKYTKRVFYLKQYAKEIKKYPIEKLLLKNLDESTEGEIGILNKFKKRKIFTSVCLDSTSGIIQMCILLLYLSYQAIVKKSISSGECAGMINAVNLLTQTLSSLFFVFPKIQKNGKYAEKIFDIIDYRSMLETNESKDIIEPFESLELKNIQFSYDNKKNVINDLSLTIKKGEKIAIVGLNGAGKTTLVNLIMRYYTLKDGEILYNGKNIGDFGINDYREKFGTIFQDFQIYAFTVKENVDMNRNTFSRDEIETMLEQVGLDDLKDKLDNVITKEFEDNGLEFSGGQKQKLALARALLTKGEIIIMDEASSALDPVSEREINDMIFEKFQDKTLIVIAHRLSTIKDVDTIYYLDNGAIVEKGSHQELMQLNGEYARMYQAQAEKYME